LGDWAIGKLREACGGGEVDVQSALRQAGFEVNISGATIEVTAESVLELMHELVGPNLRELFDNAVAKGQK
jgi:hypothetical protein